MVHRTENAAIVRPTAEASSTREFRTFVSPRLGKRAILSRRRLHYFFHRSASVKHIWLRQRRVN
jgi:hypothetical protein